MTATQTMAEISNAADAAAAPLVAVTGASGHLGANLIRALLAEGRRVRAIVRQHSRGIDGLPVEVARADLLDRDELARALKGAATVYHLAAKVSAGWEPASEVHRVNVAGTQNLLAACRASGVRRLVHFSSVQALAPSADSPIIDESSPLISADDRRRSAYDLAKAEAERRVLAAVADGLDAVILNPTAVLGPFDFQPSPMGEILLALARGRLPALVANASHDFVDARDVAAAALAAERAGRRGERYLVSGTRLSLVDLAARWATCTGRPAPRLAAPMWLAALAAPLSPAWARFRARRPLFTSESLRVLRRSLPVSSAKAGREFGYHARPIHETLRDTWAWWQSEGRA
jgi:dihydroflavonol-4-reductase